MTGGKKYLPRSEEEAAELVREAGERRQFIGIEGGGTKNGIGRPQSTGMILSTSAVSGVTAYRPEEMVISARAGTPLQEVEEILREKGQRLPFEPIDHRNVLGSEGTPTIGAVAAMNNSGPRRILAGAARDSLLGIRFINGKGEVLRSGGRVMKNVTGLDLTRLMAGSWGTLGLITEVTFKVTPVAATERTLALLDLDDENAARAMALAMASSAEVSAAAHLPEMISRRLLAEGARTVLRIEGFPESVADRISRLMKRFEGVAAMQQYDAADSRVLWNAVANATPFCSDLSKPLWRVTLAPSQSPAFLMALRMQIAADAYYDWQGGLIWIGLEQEACAEEIRTELARHGGGNAMLLRTPPGLQDEVQIFQPVPAPVAALSAGIRKALDPFGVFDSCGMDIGQQEKARERLT